VFTIGCVIVISELQCNTVFNGIFLGNTPDPCGANQTDCPAGVGPLFADFDLCAIDGDYISYLTGDCYISQVAVVQNNRAGGIGGAGGCVDTNGDLGGPLGNDFIVITEAPVGPGNVLLNSTCCDTISINVPFCDATVGPWNAICASYANTYALAGTGICLRTILSPAPPNICFSPLGPIVGNAIVQPSINMNAIGAANAGILLSNNGTGLGVIFAAFTINDTTGFRCADGGCQLELYSDVGAGLGTPDITIPLVAGSTLTGLAIAVGAALNGWSATVEGAGTTLVTLLHPTTQTLTYDSTYLALVPPANPIISQSITTVPFTGFGCISPVGLPSFPRTTTTPDYATMGLLSWMSPLSIPNIGGPTFPAQLLAMPNSTVNLTPNQITHVQQLMPWPMGGANIFGASLLPPLSAFGSGLGWWGGDGGIDLFPDAPNSGGFGGQEVYLGAYGYGQFWEDDGVGVNGAFGNGVQVAVLDWSAFVQQRSIVDEFGVTVNLGGFHEEFLTAAGALRVQVEGTATGHTPQILLFDENLPFGYSADHGTAVLGVIGANWSTNAPTPGVTGITMAQRLTGAGFATPNVGVLGIVPDATLFFFPLATTSSPDREEQAWFNAIETMNAGDVICAAYRPVAIAIDRPNINFWEDTAVYIEIANNLGIITVLRSGEGGIDINELELPEGITDQNAIVATSVTPRFPI